MLGIAIGENTAIMVENNQLEVIGTSYLIVCGSERRIPPDPPRQDGPSAGHSTSCAGEIAATRQRGMHSDPTAPRNRSIGRFQQTVGNRVALPGAYRRSIPERSARPCSRRRSMIARDTLPLRSYWLEHVQRRPGPDPGFGWPWITLGRRRRSRPASPSWHGRRRFSCLQVGQPDRPWAILSLS